MPQPKKKTVKRGRVGKWVKGAAFRVRRTVRGLEVDIKRAAPAARKRNSIAPRASRSTKKKVLRRVGAALKKYVSGRARGAGRKPNPRKR